MHAPSPPSRPQWNGKQSLLIADNCVSDLSSFCRQSSKKQNLVKKNRNHTEIERKQRGKKRKPQQNEFRVVSSGELEVALQNLVYGSIIITAWGGDSLYMLYTAFYYISM